MMRTTTRPVTRFPQRTTSADAVVVEEPMEIRVEGRPMAVTLRTPGDDFDLVTGFLVTEGVIDGADDLSAMAHVTDDLNIVDVRLAAGVEAHQQAIERATRELYANSSCGLCGKASIDRVVQRTQQRARVPEVNEDALLRMAVILRSHQPAFDKTGGLHAAALFSDEEVCLVAREDVGRHNAVDKVIGAAMREELDLSQTTLIVSSRAGFEIVQKAAVAGIAVVAVVGAPTSMAIDLAIRNRMALIGFLRDARLNQYA
jgi:FdhD protein